ncbi:threonine/serine exporter family protein [Intestinibacillus massiliensis]|nr:threonine/serine exporter family protein [Intestinibacillus massiliensis]
MGQLRMTTPQLLEVAVQVGRRLLECGAETYRVEESMHRICMAYGARDAHVYAVPTSIIATVERPGEAPLTRTYRIRKRGVNLDRLDRLNALSRRLCAQMQAYDAAQELLREIDDAPGYGKWTLRLAFGAIAAFFTLLFGGGAACAVVAFAVGLCLKLVVDAFERMEVNSMFANLVGGALIAAAALTAARLGLVARYDRVIIGSIMTLVPGLAITNSMRDLIAGDFLAGITKFSEALLIGASIAAGASIPLSLLRYLWGI